MVMLSTEGFKALFGPGSAYTYLNRTLRRQGELLDNYYGVAGSPLANEIALLSGQGPTPQTMQDCPQFTAGEPGHHRQGQAGPGRRMRVPAATANLPDQLVANGQTWKGYIEGMDTIAPAAGSEHDDVARHDDLPTSSSRDDSYRPADRPVPTPRRTVSTPGATVPDARRADHRAVDLDPRTDGRPGAATSADTTGASTTTTSASGPTTTASGAARTAASDSSDGLPPSHGGAADTDQSASTSSPYVTWRNPFVYFASITNSTECAQSGRRHQPAGQGSQARGDHPDAGLHRPQPVRRRTAGQPAHPARAPDAEERRGRRRRLSEDDDQRDRGFPGLRQRQRADRHHSRERSAERPRTRTRARAAPTRSTRTCRLTHDHRIEHDRLRRDDSGTTTSGATSAPANPPTTSTTDPNTTTTGRDDDSGDDDRPSTTPSSTTSTTTTPAPTAPLTGGSTTPTGGGGQIGLLLISKYVKPGSEDTLDYFNHYSLLGSVEQLFTLDRIGYAADPQLTLFQPGVVYNHYTP